MENVERVMMEDKPPPEKRRKNRCRKSRALVGASRWYLSAVFIPMAFFGGSTGQYRRSLSLLFQQWRFQYRLLILTPRVMCNIAETSLCRASRK
ncbi:hypothetical protein DMI70_10580 [Escherichia coli]|nr:hypothetical protein [Escherichia coli]